MRKEETKPGSAFLQRFCEPRARCVAAAPADVMQELGRARRASHSAGFQPAPLVRSPIWRWNEEYIFWSYLQVQQALREAEQPQPQPQPPTALCSPECRGVRAPRSHQEVGTSPQVGLGDV